MKILNLLNILGKAIYTLVFLALLSIAAVVMFSVFNIPGNYKLFAVQSGSMEPKIKLGSVVVVKPQDKYLVGDIITVKDPANPKEPVTHRIYSIEEATGGAVIRTKGDANETPDAETREQKDVLGKVFFSIPFLGFISSYAKTRDGLIFLIIIPTTIIVYSELLTIKNEAIRLVKERKNRKLTKAEELEVEIGEEEIKIEHWFKRLMKKIFKK